MRWGHNTKQYRDRELSDQMFDVRPQTPHTHLQLAATSKIKEFPSKNQCNSWNVPKGFYRKKLHLIQHLLWILCKEDGSLFTRKAHTSGTTTMWSPEPIVWTWLNLFSTTVIPHS